jgi:hypothetical protein
MWPGQLTSHAIPKAQKRWLPSHPTSVGSQKTGHLLANKETDVFFLPLKETAAPEQTCKVRFSCSL